MVTEKVGELEAIIARNALKYDLLPYESKPFAQSQPARIGAISILFGLQVQSLANARVLELGCASGGNIIPLAAIYPDAKFVGIDLARTQVAAGRARIERLGLSNIEILCKSFTEVGEELGEFDYIICHGVYSWVPQQVQDVIMRVIRARLSPLGVACVSYNVLPGWRMIQPLRDALLLGVQDGLDMLGRVRSAREMLTFMAQTSPDKGAYGQTLRTWAERLSSLPDDYIAHEFLEDCNNPCLVQDFALAAGRHGLAYLGECELSAMVLDNYGGEVAEGVRTRAGNDLMAAEQWLDILSGRTFRQSLLVAGERAGSINRNLTADAISRLDMVLPAGTQFKRDQNTITMQSADGRSVTAHSPAAIRFFEALAENNPASVNLDLLTAGLEPDERNEILQLGYGMFIGGILHASSEPVVCAPKPSAMPVASALARNDAIAGVMQTTNLRHEAVSIDPGSQVILPLLDGTRDTAAIEQALFEAAKDGRITFNRDNAPLTDPAELQKAAAEFAPNLLAGLAASALLSA